MKKKLMAMAVALLATTAASAQFEEGKTYIGGSLTGLNASYSGSDKLCLGIQAQGGYFVADDIMLYGQVGYDHNGNKEIKDRYSVGVGGRYYIEQNGVFLGANCKFLHASGGYDDIMPGVEVGYAFFLSRTVTVEPAIYYDQSFKKHSDFSTIGLRLGVGIYLFKE